MTHTILITDDNDDALQSLAVLLRTMGHQAVPARTVREALDILDERSDIDIVLSDIRMPDVDGFDFLRVLRNRFPALPIVLVTGLPIEKEDVVPREASILQKPFRADELEGAIATALQRKQEQGRDS
jgi:DNA-binding response OmpR family regulator